MGLSAVDLICGYGKDPIVTDPAFQARKRELTALIGPNGCGKSTALKAMARVLSLDAGTVRIGYLDVHGSDSGTVARLLSLLPQGLIAAEGLSVRELVAQGRFP